MDIFSHDISSTNIETSHLKLMDLSARNISDFSMIGDLNINNNNIKNVSYISEIKNQGHIKLKDPLYFTSGNDILMNNNNIFNINTLHGYNNNLIIDSAIDIYNNNITNIKRISGFNGNQQKQ